MEDFPTIIKRLRESKNLTQKDLSGMLGMKTYTTITKWEAGDNFPKGKDIKRLADIFEVSSDYLLGLTNETGSKIIRTTSQLEETRQKVVLDTANIQLKEQDEENAKVVSIKNKEPQQSIDLAELVDDSKIDWDKWVSFDGRPLTDEVKEAMKKALGKRLETKD